MYYVEATLHSLFLLYFGHIDFLMIPFRQQVVRYPLDIRSWTGRGGVMPMLITVDDTMIKVNTIMKKIFLIMFSSK